MSDHQPPNEAESTLPPSTLEPEKDEEKTPVNSRSSLESTRKDDNGDLEKADPEKTLAEATQPEDKDPNIVDWDGENDPANPLNWSMRKKGAHILSISLITFLVPLASSMFAPGVSLVAEEFDETRSIMHSLVVSIYVLGLAFGPMVLAPLSEVYGRWICYAGCNVLYVVFTAACGLSTNIAMLTVFRLLCGIAGSAPLAVGGGSIADMFPVEQRGRALGSLTIGPVFGPVIGPVAGGYLAQDVGWRWIFWVLTIASGVATVYQILFTRETFAPLILERKTKRLRKQTGNMALRSKLDKNISNQEIFIRAIVRPTKMLLFSPISIFFAVSCAIVYGVLYLLLTTFPMVFSDVYGFGPGTSGLTYIGLGVGCVSAMLTFSLTSDRFLARQVAKGNTPRPEHRLPLLIGSGPLLAVGLFWFGWSAESGVHWIVPILGSALAGAGCLLFMMPMMGYLVDAFNIYAASALAANSLLRSIGGAMLPLAGPSMFDTLGFGWGCSLLAFIVLGFSPALLFIYRYGEYIRTRWEIKL